MPTTQAERFSSCVKDVKSKIKLKKKLASTKEGAAIAICTRAILWPQKRTIRHFSMKDDKPLLITQKRKTGGRRKGSLNGLRSKTLRRRS